MKVKTDVKAGGVEPSPFIDGDLRAVRVFQLTIDEDGFIPEPEAYGG